MENSKQKTPWLLLAISFSLLLCPISCQMIFGAFVFGMQKLTGENTPSFAQLTYNLSPDGQQAIVSTDGGMLLYLLDLKTGSKKKLAFPNGPMVPGSPTRSISHLFSPMDAK
ncbi:MAG: hypothetical protein QM758_11815 [Armatimonas sp.]